MARMTDDQIVALIEAEESEALGSEYDELTSERADALDRYNQRLYGWEVEGRSKYVSNAIRDQIEQIMPSIARVFLSGDEVGRFEPIGPDDEAPAQAESEVVNHCVMKGGGWQAIYSACKDALLLKNGYILVQWETDSSVVSEMYTGLAPEELALLMQDKEVKVVEHTERPEFPGAQMMLDEMGNPLPAPMVHDVRVERVQPTEGLRLDAVPPDEVLVSGKHRSVSVREADFVQIRREITIGELRDAGYDVPDDIADDGNDTEEGVARSRFDYQTEIDDDVSPDPTRRRVLFRQTWIKAALDGGKTPKLWKLCIVGKKLISKEQADLIPVAAFSPIWYPHSHVGVSYYDLLQDLAEAETVVARQYFDSLYLATAPQLGVDYNRVNLDDLLTRRPGGVVRTDGPPGEVMWPVPTLDAGPTAQAGLEWISQQRENRTGLARVNQGTLDPNALNRTATGAQLMQSAGQARLEATARLLAEGVKDLYLISHAILQKHSTKPIQIQLKGQWAAVQPREWTRRTDFQVSVALGTGSPEAQLAKLQMITQEVPLYLQMGLMNPEKVYALAAEKMRVAGYRTPTKFLIEPQPGQPAPQPGPPPEVMAAQAMAQGQVQKAQVDGQVSLQKAQGDSQTALQQEAVKQQNENLRNLQDNATKIIIARMQQQNQAVAADKQLAFKAQESDKDRMYSAAGAERDREFQAQDAEANRAHQADLAAAQREIEAQTRNMK